jgi:hypothetical protein
LPERLLVGLLPDRDRLGDTFGTLFERSRHGVEAVPCLFRALTAGLARGGRFGRLLPVVLVVGLSRALDVIAGVDEKVIPRDLWAKDARCLDGGVRRTRPDDRTGPSSGRARKRFVSGSPRHEWDDGAALSFTQVPA